MTPKQVLELAKRVAWTPCQHYTQCIGYCPICLWNYWEGNHETTIQPEAPTT